MLSGEELKDIQRRLVSQNGYCVYALIRTETGEPCYVGRTKYPYHRYQVHCRDKDVDIKILEDNPDKPATHVERRWIIRLGERGYDLLNDVMASPTRNCGDRRSGGSGGDGHNFSTPRGRSVSRLSRGGRGNRETRTRRTVRFSDHFWEELGKLAKEKKESRTELIRRAVEEEYGVIDEPTDDSDHE